MTSISERFWRKVNKQDKNACWEWTAALNNGYGWFNYSQEIGSKHAHRVAAELSGLLTSINNGLHVLHKCDNPKCCNPAHFFLGTNADNVTDRGSKGRTVTPHLHGQDNGSAKLTNAQIKQIRSIYPAANRSQSDIAKQFGVGQVQISRIVSGARCGGVV